MLFDDGKRQVQTGCIGGDWMAAGTHELLALGQSVLALLWHTLAVLIYPNAKAQAPVHTRSVDDLPKADEEWWRRSQL